MKVILYVFILLCLTGLISSLYWYDKGRKDAYNDFLLERCWVGKSEMNIQCHVYEGSY